MRVTLAFVAGLALALGCQSNSLPTAADSAPRPLTLALNWFPEAEHGGFYAALVHGFFEQEGLEVEIVPGGPGSPVVQQTAGRQVDFAIANADQVLLGRDQGTPVVAVMATMQDSPRCIMVHADSGIESLSDLRDVTLAVGTGKPYAKYLLAQLGDVGLDIIPYHGSVAMFLERSDFAQQGYVFSEPYVAEKGGADPHCLMVSDIGFNPYAGLLITHEQTVAEQSVVVASFVRACARGWEKYLADPDETNRYIHQLNEEMGLDILAYGAEAIRPLCLPAGRAARPFGGMEAERWKTLAGQLHEIELLDDPTRWSEAFDARFVEQDEP